MKLISFLRQMIESSKWNFHKGLTFLFFLFIILAIGVAIQKYFQSGTSFWGNEQTHYNNFIIFKNSFGHLFHHQNLYDLYEKEYGDFYKYSPTFAFLMAPFYLLPNFAGLLLWNFLNCVLIFWGIKKLPQISDKTKFLILAFSIIELITSIQNQQSNALIAGLLLLAFSMMEKQKTILPTLLIMLCFYTKLTGILATVFFLFYEKKWKLIAWSTIWIIVLAALPLLIISKQEFVFQYQSWINLLVNDHVQSAGVSIYGLVQFFLSNAIPKNTILIIGIILFLVPLLKRKCFSQFNFRLNYFCSLLIWIVIFNHKAESSSYILAFVACAIWYFTNEKTRLNTLLFVFCFLFISLSPTDLFPKIIRNNFIVPYHLKALPAVLVWITITFRLLIDKNEKTISIKSV